MLISGKPGDGNAFRKACAARARDNRARGDDLREHRPRHPKQVEQLLAHPDFANTNRASLRVADPRLVPGHAGEGIRTPEGHRMALGMTETFGPFSWGSGGDNHIGPIQDIQPGLQVRVVDEDNAPVGDGETGCAADASRPVTTSGPGTSDSMPTDGFTRATVGWSRATRSTTSGA